MAMLDEVGWNHQFVHDGIDDGARLGVAEEAEGQGDDVGVERRAHPGENPLGDEGLQDVDHVLAGAGDEHRRQVIPAVQQQQVHVAQGDGLVDDALLHLERQDPREHRDRDHAQQGDLPPEVPVKHPGKQGPFDDGAFNLGHGHLLVAQRAGHSPCGGRCPEMPHRR